MAVVVLVDRDDIGDRLAPRQLVRVVFVGSDEDDRPLFGRDLVGQVVGVLEHGRNPETEYADHLGDRTGRSAAAEQHGVFVGGADAFGDDPAGIFAELGRLQPGARRLGVGVGVQGQHDVGDVVLDERQRATRCGVVGVHDRSWPERPIDHLRSTDHRRSDRVNQAGGFGHWPQGSDLTVGNYRAATDDTRARGSAAPARTPSSPSTIAWACPNPLS